MNEEQQRRRGNLVAVVHDRGGHARVVEALRLTQSQASYLSQLMNGYSFGEKSARNWEARLKLPKGSLDLPVIVGSGATTFGPVVSHATGTVSEAPPTLHQALPVVLDALSRLTPGRWGMVLSGLQPLSGHPEMRDDVMADILPLLSAQAEPRKHGTSA